MEKFIEEWMACKLEERKQEKAFRSLSLTDASMTDFSSNDYLGFARNRELAARISKAAHAEVLRNGSGGSRLIAGNSALAEGLERQLALFFKAAATLLFNSGYMANQGIFSALPRKGDTIIYDELAHACIKDGARLSAARRYAFRHNDPDSLRQRLKRASGQAFVGVESVYSMDGDMAPLQDIASVCREAGAALIVDEAHSTGIYEEGRGLVCALGLEDEVFARIYTFGKAMGCHGACIAGSENLRNYLINFARPFIYTTAMPPHAVCTVREAFHYLQENPSLPVKLQARIAAFNGLKEEYLWPLLPQEVQIHSESPIQAIVLPGIEWGQKVAAVLRQKGYELRPILAPTVPAGKERLRICLHVFNTEEEIKGLVQSLAAAL